MPDKNKPAIPPALTVAEYARFQMQGGQHFVDLLLRVARNYEVSENKVEEKKLEKVDPAEKLAGVIAIAALTHLANGPRVRRNGRKGGSSGKSVGDFWLG